MYKQIAYKGQIIKFNGGNNKVVQIGGEATNADYEILLSGTANDDYYIGETRKTASLKYNPNTKNFTVENTTITETTSDRFMAVDYSISSPTSVEVHRDNFLWDETRQRWIIMSAPYVEITNDDIFNFATWDGTNFNLTDSLSNKVSKSGDTMSGDLTISALKYVILNGGNLALKTNGSSSNDSGDIVWYYGNGQEKMRLFTDNTYGARRGFNYRLFSENGTALGAGRLLVTDGDTMTGALTFDKTVTNAIQFAGTKGTYSMISFKDNTADANGNGIYIGGGGATIIGGGESANTMANSLSSGGDEVCYIGNDGNVNVFSNLQNGWSSRKTFTFDTSGNFTVADGLLKSTCNGNTVTIGSQNTAYCHIYNSANISFYFNKPIITSSEIFKSDGTNMQICGKNDSAIIYLRGKEVEGKKATTLTGYIPFYGSSFTNPSSRRIKENIKDLTNEDAKKILNINTVSFDFIDGWGEKNQYGVIAEEVEEIIPFVVQRSEDYKEDEPISPTNKPLSVDYSKFVPFLIKMVQIQEERIKELEDKLL